MKALREQIERQIEQRYKPVQDANTIISFISVIIADLIALCLFAAFCFFAIESRKPRMI